MTLTRAHSALKAAVVVFAAACAPLAAAQEALVPTPKAVIYPGDLILDGMLADVPNPARDGSGPFVDSRSLIVGKVARLTLLPGHAIPFSGVSNRKLVSNGAEVKLVFSEGDLLIMTTAQRSRTARSETSSGSATTTAASPRPAPSSRTARSK